MDKWEYLSVYIASTSILGNQLGDRKIYKINGKELDNWKKGLPLYEHLNQLGEQGWEMVSVSIQTVEIDIAATGFFWFKRKKV